MSAFTDYTLLSEANKRSVSAAIAMMHQKQVEEKQMPRFYLNDAQVEQEIARLKESDFVKLARKEQRIRYQRRQVLYNLRDLEKKGKALAAAGITLDMLDGMDEEALAAVME